MEKLYILGIRFSLREDDDGEYGSKADLAYWEGRSARDGTAVCLQELARNDLILNNACMLTSAPCLPSFEPRYPCL